MTPDTKPDAERDEDAGPRPGVKLHIYTFIEEEGQLRVKEAAREFGCVVVLWGGLALAGLGALAGMLRNLDPATPRWWLLIPAGLGALGGWLLVRTILRGRTLWLFDRASGNVYRRGKLLRTMASITSIGFFAMEVSTDISSGGVLWYVWFAPNQGHRFVPGGALGLRKDLLCFESMKDASQAATLLASYLGVEVISQLIE